MSSVGQRCTNPALGSDCPRELSEESEYAAKPGNTTQQASTTSRTVLCDMGDGNQSVLRRKQGCCLPSVAFAECVPALHVAMAFAECLSARPSVGASMRSGALPVTPPQQWAPDFTSARHVSNARHALAQSEPASPLRPQDMAARQRFVDGVEQPSAVSRQPPSERKVVRRMITAKHGVARAACGHDRARFS